MEKSNYFRILDSEMELAAGCTEPGAIALTAAYAAAELKKLGDEAQSIRIQASANIIKNAMAAGIPGTPYTGIPYVGALGTLAAAPEKQLEVAEGLPQAIYEAAHDMVEAGKVTLELSHAPNKLYIEVALQGRDHTARAVIADLHTNLVLLEVDGRTLLERGAAGGGDDVVTPEEIADFLTVRGIYDFCHEELDPVNDPIDIIRSAVAVNSAISEAGLERAYGLGVGPGLAENCEKGFMTRDMVVDAMSVTAAGADARMAGAPYSVVTNSGSGNQGITATMPVVALARWKGVSEETLLRAVTLSNLITIRIKSKFGRLSALCGATVASTGAACGIVYLLGGGYEEICRAIHNMVGNVVGLVCDGAKADCALKISTCVNAAFQAALMALRGVRVQDTDGIVEWDVEKSLDNFTTLGNEGSGPLDAAILHMMLSKERAEC